MFRRTLPFILVAFPLVAGCSRATAPPTNNTSAAPEVVTQVVTEVVERVVVERIVTATPDPVQSSEEAAATTPTAEPTVCPVAPDNLTIYGIGFLKNGDLLFTLDQTQHLLGEALAVTAQSQRYPCETQSASPNRLYCIGPALEEGIKVHLELETSDGGCSLFEQDVSIPRMPKEEDSSSSGGGGDKYP